jgi:hypothetical protein
MMTAVHTISIDLPAEPYDRVNRVAELSRCSIEQALLEGMPWLYTTVFADILTSLEKLESLSTIELWAIVYQRLRMEDESRFEELKQIDQRTNTEQHEIESLLGLLDYQILLRSKALAVLKERGQAIDLYLN